MERTDQPAGQPSPVLPKPSYARQVVELMADTLNAQQGPLTEGSLRRAYTIAVAATVHDLPNPVANEVSEKVGRVLPPLTAGITHSQYALWLRDVGEGL